MNFFKKILDFFGFGSDQKENTITTDGAMMMEPVESIKPKEQSVETPTVKKKPYRNRRPRPKKPAETQEPKSEEKPKKKSNWRKPKPKKKVEE